MRFNMRAASAIIGLAAAAVLGLSVSPAPATSVTPALATVISHQVAPSVQKLEGPRTAANPARIVEVSESSQVKVHGGDTLSSIAKDACGHADRWPNIWKANRKLVKNPNVIDKGWKLTLPGCGKVSRHTLRAALAAVPVIHVQAPNSSSASSSVESPVSAPAASSAPVASSTVSTDGMGAFQACVINAESGGNSQVVNASDHYGLYQFAESTWVAHGGNPADFGHASVAEQNAVFAATYAADGTSDWAPYDGC